MADTQAEQFQRETLRTSTLMRMVAFAGETWRGHFISGHSERDLAAGLASGDMCPMCSFVRYADRLKTEATDDVLRDVDSDHWMGVSGHD